MSELRIGAAGFRLEAALTEDVIAIVGRRGRGKTTTAVVLVEELHRVGARFCVLDPVGVWWGLKSSKDGKAAGIPVVVMGGEHADVPLEDTAGKVIADFVADPESPSVVLDFRGFRKGQIVRFATDFLEQLYHRNRAPLHLVLDESDQFAPQRVMGETARLVGAAEDVCKMGRARGLHPIVITQRPAALNKNVLTQAGLLVAHALTGPQDQKAVDEWIRANAEEDQREKFLGTIAGLTRGVAWFWQPTIPIFERVLVRDRRTFDSSATPKRGETVAPKVLAEGDLEALKKRIAGTIEKAKAEDPRELRKKIAQLEKDYGELRRHNDSAHEKLAAREPKAKRVEVQVLKDAQVKRLEAAIAKAGVLVDGDLPGLTKRLEEILRGASDRVAVAAADLQNSLRAVQARPAPPSAPVGRGIAALIPDRPGPHPLPPRPPRAVAASNGDIPPARQRILDALAWLESVGIRRAERTQLALLADTSPTSSAYANNLGALRTSGLIDYAGPGEVVLTEGGRGAAHADDSPTTSEEIQRAILGKLAPAKGRILQALIGVYPQGLSRGALADLAAASNTSSAYANNLGSLRSLGLIDYRAGEVVARPVLFLEG